jgi:release factor glutamine methyltransferase
MNTLNTASISVPILISTLQKPLVAYYECDVLAEQHAWWLLSAITSKSKTNLLSSGRITLSAEDYHTLQHWVVDLTVNHKPIAYILGTIPFADLNLAIEPPILIPRPETEEWVVNLIDELSKLSHQSLRILDVGTGSGCIALALAYAFPEAQVVGIDYSEKAIALAQANMQQYALDNVTLLQSDFFSQIPENSFFDLIVSNPPYINSAEWAFLEPSVTQWEDEAALISQEEGYAHLFKIISYAPMYLRANPDLKAAGLPNVIVEIGESQGPTVAQFMKEQGAQTVSMQSDASGKDRVVKGHFYVADQTPEF